MQSREANLYIDASWRIQAVLRNIEKLQRGILWLTTNRPVDIDSALDSRIRVQIYFPALDRNKRRMVWAVTLPKDMFPCGLTDGQLDQLAEIEINGREIKNAIMNAADRASFEGLDSVPMEYILEAAKTIHKNQEILDRAKRGYKKDGPIGFLRGDADK